MFRRVRHDKLAEVMVKAGIPDLERRLIINLYWRQHAAVRWDGEVSREVGVERGVRQGCVISPILLALVGSGSGSGMSSLFSSRRDEKNELKLVLIRLLLHSLPVSPSPTE